MRPLLCALAVATAGICVACGSSSGRTPVEAKPGPIVFRDGFNSRSLSRWQLHQSAAPGRIQVVHGFAGRRGRVVRFEVRGGDRVGGDADSRAELGWMKRMAGEGDSFDYSWWTYFPRGYPIDRRWQSIAQFKNEGSGAPPLHVGVDGRCLDIVAGPPQYGGQALWRTRLVRGRWLHLQLRVGYSSNPRIGSVQAALNGVEVLPTRHLSTLYPGQRSYFKLGLYRDAGISRTGVVFDDQLVIRRSGGPPPGRHGRRPPHC